MGSQLSVLSRYIRVVLEKSHLATASKVNLREGAERMCVCVSVCVHMCACWEQLAERSREERDDGSWTSVVLIDFCHLEYNINMKVISIIKEKSF